VLYWAEQRLARLCIEEGQPPLGAPSVALWVAWYTWCAQRIKQLSSEECSALLTRELRDLRRHLVSQIEAPDPTIPEVVIADPRESVTTPGGVFLAGYSQFDVVRAGPAVIHFLSRLDGRRTWRQALAETRDAVDEVLDEQVIHELFRVHVLQEVPQGFTVPAAAEAGPEGREEPALPEVLVAALQPPIISGGQVLIKGEDSQESVIAPMTVFVFLSKLDGQRRWREAYKEMAEQCDPPMDERLVADLFRIGALRPPRRSDLPPRR